VHGQAEVDGEVVQVLIRQSGQTKPVLAPESDSDCDSSPKRGQKGRIWVPKLRCQLKEDAFTMSNRIAFKRGVNCWWEQDCREGSKFSLQLHMHHLLQNLLWRTKHHGAASHWQSQTGVCLSKQVNSTKS